MDHLGRTCDWIVKAAKLRTDGVAGLHVEIENLCWPENHLDRHASWTLPSESLSNPRYDWTAVWVWGDPVLRPILLAARPDLATVTTSEEIEAYEALCTAHPNMARVLDEEI